MISFNISFFLLVLIFIFSTSYLIINLSLFNKNQKLCIATVTDLQLKHRRTLQRLLSLNNKAKALRLERATAEKAVKFAPHPAAKATAAAWLAKVTLAQTAFKVVQLGILKHGDLETNRKRLSQKIKINTRVLRLRALLNQRPISSPTPSYFLKKNFTYLKKITVTTNTRLLVSNMKSISTLERSLGVTYKCQATIQHTKQKLKKIRLIADKQSLKYLAF